MNIIKSLLIILLGSLILLACQKDDSTPIQKNVNAEANYLSFKDRNAFDEAANSKDLKELNRLRTSNFKSLKDTRNNLGIKDEFILSCLNADGEIKIGQWLFKLNGLDRTVKLLNPTSKAVIGNFTFDDDVFDLLEAGITSTPSNQKVKLFCGESGVSERSHDDDYTFIEIHYSGGQSVWSGTCTNYEKLGIYFSLVLEWAVFDNGYATPYKEYRNFYEEYWFKPKCRGEHHEIMGDDTSLYPDWIDINNKIGNGNKHKVYASTTALHAYKTYQKLTFHSHGTEILEGEVNHGY